MDLFSDLNHSQSTISKETVEFVNSQLGDWLNFIEPGYVNSAYEAVEYLKSIPPDSFTPGLTECFRIFREIKPTDVRVAVISKCPYPDPRVGDGIAFSCVGDCSPTLLSIFDNWLEDKGHTIDNPGPYKINGNLDYLVKQGVFLANTVLTVEIYNADSHNSIGWTKFMDGVLRAINRATQKKCVFLFWGSEPARVFRHFSTKIAKGRVHTCEHPVASAKNLTLWDCDHFRILEKENINIDWMLTSE